MIAMLMVVLLAATTSSSGGESPGGKAPAAAPGRVELGPGERELSPLESPDAPGEDRWRLTLEAGALWSNRNDVSSPGDTGTRFSLNDLTGEGAFPVGRITLEHELGGGHGLRFLYAPVRTDGSGELQKAVTFEGESFTPGRATARYQFDTYRLAYRYRFHESQDWTWRGGVTALVRDASIEVSQAGRRGRKTDLGVVPLLNLTGEWRFADRWQAVFDFEGSAAPQGRAFDVALTAGYELRPGLLLSLGYRTIEGGADNDEVFTFTWVNSAIVSLRWSL